MHVQMNVCALPGFAVTTVDELLEKGATPKGREELVAKSGLPAANILKFVNYADLYRIKGIAGQTAELLEAAGVNTVAELLSATRRTSLQR